MHTTITATVSRTGHLESIPLQTISHTDNLWSDTTSQSGNTTRSSKMNNTSANPNKETYIHEADDTPLLNATDMETPSASSQGYLSSTEDHHVQEMHVVPVLEANQVFDFTGHVDVRMSCKVIEINQTNKWIFFNYIVYLSPRAACQHTCIHVLAEKSGTSDHIFQWCMYTSCSTANGEFRVLAISLADIERH